MNKQNNDRPLRKLYCGGVLLRRYGARILMYSRVYSQQLGFRRRTPGSVKNLFVKRIALCVLMIVTNGLSAKTYTVMLGDTPVKIIQETTQKNNPKTLVHLHENETTALAAARQYVHREGGTLITLQHGGTRNIAFHLHRVRYEVDPNRIFTDQGIKLTLRQFGSYSTAAHAKVKVLAQKILSLIPAGKVVAVHNNRDYSLTEYFPQHALQKDAAAIHYLEHSNRRNFYFVTKKAEFQRLKSLKFNVALQALTARDDGSLSYYLGDSNYINIEAAYGQLQEQLGMLYHS